MFGSILIHRASLVKMRVPNPTITADSLIRSPHLIIQRGISMTEIENFNSSRVCDIVTKSPGRASVFTRHGIDFCCGGTNPLSQTCMDLGLSISEVVNDLIEFDHRNQSNEIENYDSMTSSELCDLIEERHHAFLRQILPVIGIHADKVAKVHGGNEPSLLEVRNTFNQLRADLEPHMMKEEMILFPLIKKLDRSTSLPESHCGSVRNPIRAMFMEHHAAGEALSKLRVLTNSYSPPNHACNTYRALFSELETLEADMHAHIHLENHVLFVRAQMLERDLMRSTNPA